jgi:hypothetical protein
VSGKFVPKPVNVAGMTVWKVSTSWFAAECYAEAFAENLNAEGLPLSRWSEDAIGRNCRRELVDTNRKAARYALSCGFPAAASGLDVTADIAFAGSRGDRDWD